MDFDREPIYCNDEKYIKTKIKTYIDSVTTNFCNKNGCKKIPEEKIPHKCLNLRFCSFSIWKASSPNIFRRM